MLDDLRNAANASLEAEDAENENRQFLGLTASQRFMLAALIFVVVTVLCWLLLVLTGRIMLPA